MRLRSNTLQISADSQGRMKARGRLWSRWSGAKCCQDTYNEVIVRSSIIELEAGGISKWRVLWRQPAEPLGRHDDAREPAGGALMHPVVAVANEPRLICVLHRPGPRVRICEGGAARSTLRKSLIYGAGERNRTSDLLITNLRDSTRYNEQLQPAQSDRCLGRLLIPVDNWRLLR